MRLRASDSWKGRVATARGSYMDEVTRIVAGALMPGLAKHRELGNVTKKFSFRINTAGRPSEITASSVPPNKFLDNRALS